MHRSRHRKWNLPSCVLALLIVVMMCTLECECVRATSLIFAKTKASTSTEAPSSPIEDTTGSSEEMDVTAEAEMNMEMNKTHKLTGNPQIDYIYDPNLPRELNGYNLSDYPFYALLPPPEEINFKCDGLHDGFYASVPHKCQLYHHCLFGIRYDFLCANYTAFDQKTFICQFVSVVDCKNSPKYFSRNEALYKAASTEPTPTTTTTTTTQAPEPTRRAGPVGRRRPGWKPYDYYSDEDEYYYPSARDDDYYDDEPRKAPRRRLRPRYRNRGQYDYDEERHDMYERRPTRTRDDQEAYPEKRPRPNKRPESRERDRDMYPEDRIPYDDEDEMRRPASRRPHRNYDRPRYDSRYKDDKMMDDDMKASRPKDRDRVEMRPYDRDEIRPRDRDEMKSRDRDEYRPRDKNRDEINKDRDEIRPRDKKRDEITRDRDIIRPRDKNRDEITRDGDEIRPRDKNRDEITRDRDIIRPKDKNRDEFRPKDERERDDYRPRDKNRSEVSRERDDRERDGYRSRDDRYHNEGRQHDESRRFREDRPYRENHRPEDDKKPEVKVKPAGGSIYSKPRVPPKIRRPVPLNERNKFEYTSSKPTTSKSVENDEYYDDYEDEEVSKPVPKATTAAPKPKIEEKPKRPAFKKRPPPVPLRRPDYEEDYDYGKPEKPRKQNSDEEFDDYEKEKSVENSKASRESKEVTQSSVETDRPLPANVKVVKRPFLPSRGGSPYLPRGLQPLGGRNFNATTSTTTTSTSTVKPDDSKSYEYDYESYEDDETSSILPVAEPESTTLSTTTSTTTTTTEPTTTTSTTTTTTEKPVFNEIPKKNDIDIKNNIPDSIENEFDISLNEAVAPKVTTSQRNYPQGFAIGDNRNFGVNRFRDQLVPDHLLASEQRLRPFQQISGVSLRTPQSFFVNPRFSPFPKDDLGPRTRTVVYRHMPVGEYL